MIQEIQGIQGTKNEPVKKRADGVLIVQLYAEEGGNTRLEWESHDAHNNHQPLDFSTMLLVFSSLKDIIFDEYRKIASPDSSLLIQLDPLNVSLTNINAVMFNEYVTQSTKGAH